MTETLVVLGPLARTRSCQNNCSNHCAQGNAVRNVTTASPLNPRLRKVLTMATTCLRTLLWSFLFCFVVMSLVLKPKAAERFRMFWALTGTVHFRVGRAAQFRPRGNNLNLQRLIFPWSFQPTAGRAVLLFRVYRV